MVAIAIVHLRKKAAYIQEFNRADARLGAIPVRQLTSNRKLGKTFKGRARIPGEPPVHDSFLTDYSQPMKIKPDQLDRLATQLVASFRKKELIVSKASDVELKARVVEAISRNFAEEEAIEEEARKMLASFAQASKDMDPFKMFLLAKQKLAAKKGFIL